MENPETEEITIVENQAKNQGSSQGGEMDDNQIEKQKIGEIQEKNEDGVIDAKNQRNKELEEEKVKNNVRDEEDSANNDKNGASLSQSEKRKKIKKDETKRTYRFKLPKTKFQLVREILKRWWYGLPDWPDKTVDYTEKLINLKLRVVPEDLWSKSPVVEQGLAKVRKIPNYDGVFQGASKEIYDFRVCVEYLRI